MRRGKCKMLISLLICYLASAAMGQSETGRPVLRYLLCVSSEYKELLEINGDKVFVTAEDKVQGKIKGEIEAKIGIALFDTFYSIPDMQQYLHTKGNPLNTNKNYIFMVTDERKGYRANGNIYVFDKNGDNVPVELKKFLKSLKRYRQEILGRAGK